MIVTQYIAAALSLGLIIGSAMPAAAQTNAKVPGEYSVYFGTYTDKGSKGIYRSTFNTATGQLSKPELAVSTTNPSFLAVQTSATNGAFLYAVNEVNEGTVSAYRIDPGTGGLTPLNTKSSHGSAPCHLSVAPGGRWLFAANYSSGSVAVLPVQPDGSLSDATNVIQNTGSSVNTNRQAGPHAHWTALTPGGQYLMTCDLGIDKVIAGHFDSASGYVATNLLISNEIKPGSGPRHMVFHPMGGFAYVINELNSTITVLAHQNSGTLTYVQTVPTVPNGAAAGNTTAEIAISPTGRFLFASNRGHDSIVAYEVNRQSGRLNFLGYTRTGGKTPRHFTIDPSGRWILVANQDSNSILVFRINQRTGELDAVGEPVTLSSPVCIQFAALQ